MLPPPGNSEVVGFHLKAKESNNNMSTGESTSGGLCGRSRRDWSISPVRKAESGTAQPAQENFTSVSEYVKGGCRKIETALIRGAQGRTSGVSKS